MTIKDEQLLIFDGACGTAFQEMNLPPASWGERYLGCNEYLNLSSPEAVIALHTSFIEAGSNVIETNTFGANPIVAKEYGLEKDVDKINRLAVDHALKAVAGRPGLYIAGSIGPSTKLPCLGHITVDEMADAYRVQILALVEAGVDILSIETCQDLLQLKTVLIAAFDVLDKVGVDIPVMVSATMERTGTMLLGTSIATVVATVEPFPVFSLGLNCATGPNEMDAHMAYLGRHWPGRISVMPNAGIPEVRDGKTIYPLSPDEFAAKLATFVNRDGVSIVGGCCGTTTRHIEALVAALDGVVPSQKETDFKPSLASLYETVEIAQEIPPLIVGERMNANGSKRFQKLLLADDFDKALAVGQSQEKNGAHLLDLCCAYAGRDEKHDMTEMIKRLGTQVKLPLVIDSTSKETIETALKICPGRPVINSVNLEDGGKTLKQICHLAKKYGAQLVALTIGRDGMAMTADDKLKVAREIHHIAVVEGGLRSSDLLFDMLTFTIGSGDPTLKNAAADTLRSIERVKKELPGVFTILGVSNISFGLPKAGRKVLNAIFLHEAIEAGLDAAIVDAGKILPVASISKEERELCLNLIYNRQNGDKGSNIDTFIEYFSNHQAGEPEEKDNQKLTSQEKQLETMLITGSMQHIEDVLTILRERYTPIDIINQILVPAMRRVGELFGRGEMLLPFVLKSAEVMKKSVGYLEPFMNRVASQQRFKVLLATVRGDVHDIGKNLVDIILSNNGFDVVNVGINVPTETIIEKAKEHKVNAIGLSGLLVKSAIIMQESMIPFNDAGLDVPILLGGAALTPRFVSESCAPNYRKPVVYCRDAFDGLKAVQEAESGTLRSTSLPTVLKPDKKPADQAVSEVRRDNPVPGSPFMGVRYIEDIDPALLFDDINKQALFRGRWGYRRGKTTEDAYAELITGKVEPILAELKDRIIEEKLFAPKVAYGYFNCFQEKDSLVVEGMDKSYRFDFPRQSFGARLSIVDYFKTQKEGGDLTGLFVVTVGDQVARETQRLFENDKYHDYLMLHGFAVEVTDALAEYWHRKMRDELNIGEPLTSGEVVCACQGTRYGFGYPACPDLDAHKTLFELLEPEKIGVRLTESFEMVPEMSTSAIVVHHPDATYFAV